MVNALIFNPLYANTTKWSNTLKQFERKQQTASSKIQKILSNFQLSGQNLLLRILKTKSQLAFGSALLLAELLKRI